MRGGFQFVAAVVSLCFPQAAPAEPAGASRVLGSGSCATSGCHGGAGPNRGAYHIWKRADPHFKASATLTNGQSKAMARKLEIASAAESASCTACHAPMRNVEPALLAPSGKDQAQEDFSCANCHGGAEDWILSHTRPEYPREALVKLGMRPLESAYQRANSCVACHQNLSDDLVKANHPPLIFELDGLLVEQPKHWREDKDFSHAKTWLVGQAVALRETAAQAAREPGDRRNAEIEAIKELLSASATGWDGGAGADLVRAADDFARRISDAPMTSAQARSALDRLMGNRKPFEIGAFGTVADEYRMWAVGYYAERVALAIDRLNQSLVLSGRKAVVDEEALDGLFKAAKPPKSFDADVAENFVRKLDGLAKSNPGAE
jgi:hypothetical protein